MPATTTTMMAQRGKDEDADEDEEPDDVSGAVASSSIVGFFLERLDRLTDDDEYGLSPSPRFLFCF